MMKPTRSLLLVTSAMIVVGLLGSGLALRVGATENSYRQAVRFAEILSLVMENYVDPVEAERLLLGAYEGMLGGLDPNGAFLTPAEVEAWKRDPGANAASPGIAVLKLGRTLQVVAVEPGSPAEDAGVMPGDHVRSVDGELVRDLSLAQARRLINGDPGTTVRLELLHPADGFEREEIELVRRAAAAAPYALRVLKGTAVLTIRDLDRVSADELFEELDDVRSRGVERLLLDLRNHAGGDPRKLDRLAGLFGAGQGTLLRLRDRSGRQVEAVEAPEIAPRWSGSLSVLVNGATAGAAEALAVLSRDLGDGTVYGESTYGLGSEAKLYELENGYGLLVSARMWETPDGKSWNVDGVEPDEVVRVSGEDYAEIQAKQMDEVLELLEQDAGDEPEVPAEAA
jgi:carboxyl-terminal processing protease